MGVKINIIVAMDAENGIGVNNSLPWSLKEDLAHFKKTTMGAPIIMGRKTYDSIGYPLPGRRNIVVTRNLSLEIAGVETVNTIIGACDIASGSGSDDVYIIGGAEIFLEALSLADALIVTKIGGTYDCDTFFPTIDLHMWSEVSREDCVSASGIRYSILKYNKL